MKGSFCGILLTYNVKNNEEIKHGVYANGKRPHSISITLLFLTHGG